MNSLSNNDIRVRPASPRPQPGPLYTKRGEIGYVEGATDEARSSSPEGVLPTRHPAERDHPTPPTTSSASNNTLISPSTTTLVSSESNNSIKNKVLCFFKPRKYPSFHGLRITTLLVFSLQLIALGGTLAGWVVIAKIVDHATDTFTTTTIFIHVLFGVCVLAELLFLERRLYRLRAERYTYLHPGEILPHLRYGRPADPGVAFSPWDRPPLPTYAAALAQSGAGTGDVEDHLIAQPPPPAYGITRGSTFLLSGFMRNSLLAQRPVSEQIDRPKSYHSRDEEWEEIQDAARARRLEETLTRLDRPRSA